MKIPLTIRLSVFRLKVSSRLWEIRGLPACPYHGYHAQSWWTGYCKVCKEKPVLPPMDDICTFCGKEKATLQRASPNGNKEIWSLCWDCDKFIDWSEIDAMNKQFAHLSIEPRELKPFDEWLFDRYSVYPKNNDYTSIILKKK